LRLACLIWVAVVFLPSIQAMGAPALTLEGWQDRARAWGPGVQAGNSSYGEDRVIPLRWIGSLKSGSTHSLVLRYDMSRGGRGVFIDSVASWDATEVGVDLAKGVTLGGPATTWPIKVDSGLPPHAQRG